ncbi:MAG TPA: hypothetical protein VGE51_13005 [Fontimonas sp.]
MKLTSKAAGAALLTLPMLVLAGVNIDHIESPTSSFDLVNDDIRIGAKSTVKDLETVNGAIELGDGTRAAGVETVNGGIELGAGVHVDDAETVNGDITAGANLTVKEDLETVNGDIRVGSNANIGADVRTVNGAISLDRAVVNGEVVVSAGTIDTGAGSRIGKIHVEDSSNSGNSKRKPRVTVGANTVVGPIVFERDGELRVHRTATVGEVTGVKATLFD